MKICPKCNLTLPDGAAFCNNCGTNLSVPYEPEPISGTPEDLQGNATFEEARQKNRNRRIGILAVCGAAAVVLLIAILIIASTVASNAYKTPIKQYVKLLSGESTDLDDYLECFLPDFAIDTYDDLHSLAGKVIPDATAEYDKQLVYYFEDSYADLKDAYGKKYKVSYEIRSKEKMSKGDLQDLEDEYAELYDELSSSADFSDSSYYDSFAAAIEAAYDVTVSDKEKKSMQKTMEAFMKNLKNLKIQAGYELEVKITVDGSDGRESEKLTLKVIKVDGNWIIDPASASELSGIGFSGSLEDIF